MSCPSGPRGRSAKPLFGGSNPPDTSNPFNSACNRGLTLDARLGRHSPPSNRKPRTAAPAPNVFKHDMAPRVELASRHRDAISALGVIAPPPIQVSTPAFDGSLAALFQCVREHRIDLLEVPLAPICEAYFEYLLLANLRDLDEAAAALVALSYLLERKAWALLPVVEVEPEMDDSAFELIEPTAHEFGTAIQSLQMWHDERSLTFFRTAEPTIDPYEVPYTLGNVTLNDLARAFERILQKAKPEEVKPLNKPRKSLSEQMAFVLRSMGNDWRSLDIIVGPDPTRSDVVYTFLALLELIRLGQVAVQLDANLDVQFARATRPA